MKRSAILFLLIMLMVACTYRKHTSDYYPQSDISYQYESEVKEPDSVIQNIPSEEPAKSHSSSYSSIRIEFPGIGIKTMESCFKIVMRS